MRSFNPKNIEVTDSDENRRILSHSMDKSEVEDVFVDDGSNRKRKGVQEKTLLGI